MSTSPYHEAGRLLTQILTEHKSLKSLTFSSSSKSNNNKTSKLSCSKSSYAQVCNTLQYKSLIDAILNYDGGKLKKNIQMQTTRNIGLFYVLLYELLFGKYGSIRGGGKLKRNIIKFQEELQLTKQLILKEQKITNVKEGTNTGRKSWDELLQQVPIFPRYVRVNTLKITVEEVVQILKKDIRQLGKKGDGDYKHDVNGDDDMQIYVDPHVPDLLVLSPKHRIQWHDHELISSGKIVLQDKSSCFSALALVHGSNNDSMKNMDNDDHYLGDYIDACAAPGNKTSHLAALVSRQWDEKIKGSKNGSNTLELPGLDLARKVKKKQKTEKNGDKQKVNTSTTSSNLFAFDRSSSRISILRNRLTQMIPPSTIVGTESPTALVTPVNIKMVPIHQDFLTVDPSDKAYKHVKNILLDPSCSGSGIVNTPDRLLGSALDSGAVNKEEGEASLGESENNRITSLANFQLVALKHAMSFPQVCRIVYSTCSVHEEENEHVVAKALREVNKGIEKGSTEWKLVSPYALRGWKRRGRSVAGLTNDQADCLIRVDGMDGDDTNGFFVSYFERNHFSAGGDSDERKETERMYGLPTGVKGFYNGEFQKDQNRNAISSSGGATDSKQIIKNTTFEKSTGKEPPKTDKKDKKIAKKKQKKLDWKRKQKELKMIRLKKKADSKKKYNVTSEKNNMLMIK